jgi:hypothetical protein
VPAPARAALSRGAVLLLAPLALSLAGTASVGAQVVDTTSSSIPAAVGPSAPVLSVPEPGADERRVEELGSDPTSRGVVIGAVAVVVLTIGAAVVALSGWRP